MTSSNDKEDKTSKSALHQLLSPDGYYHYLQITKPPLSHSRTSPLTSSTTSDDAALDKSTIEKNYRRLSRKHHPDRPTGDAETFRLLERAKTVLMSDVLRKEYDLLGLDLEEEEDTSHVRTTAAEKEGGEEDQDTKDAASGGGPDTIVSHMASATVAAIMQLAVRTVMMTVASTIVARYKVFTIPAILFLLYTTYQIRNASTTHSEINTYDIASPTLVGVGVALMHLGRGETYSWSWTFWLGEVTVMTLFALNTLNQSESPLKPSILLGIGAFVAFTFLCLWIRGKFWRYCFLLGVEFVLALVAVIIFPIIEMLVEELMNEKIKKVGEKVRTLHKTMQDLHKIQLDDAVLRAGATSGVSASSSGGGSSGGGGMRLRYNNSGGEID